MAIKNFLFGGMIVFILSSCANPKREGTENPLVEVNNDTATTAVVPSENPIPVAQKSDTVKSFALPPVEEGDVIFQNMEAPLAQQLGAVTESKYNHVGLIFRRKRDGLLMVMEAADSVRTMGLTEWVARGIDKKVCVMRLKDAQVMMNEKRTKQLKDGCRLMAKLPADPAMSWGDDAMYSSELVWKAYNNSLRVELCAPRMIKDFNLSAVQKKEIKDKYGKTPSDTDPAVSPDDLYHSQKLQIIYEN